jgi:hypothetical protein
MTYISKLDLEKILDDKWKEYRNRYEHGDEHGKVFSKHAMLTVKGVGKDIKEHFSKKRLF